MQESPQDDVSPEAISGILSNDLPLSKPNPKLAVQISDEDLYEMDEAARQLSIMQDITLQAAMRRIVNVGIALGKLSPNTIVPKARANRDCLNCGKDFRPVTSKPFCSADCFKEHKGKK